ncbi:E3 ubiquitin-protein ligase makorin [Senna tora]|uniref:E3 ubiquitin-protein ligase makorin n=1 Tax=Senna tora TaxID=362788 RepID=A0A834X0R5_9FABA|nr:E3 ubiquitin-protein ligase makorin [Senna tora]
MKSTKITAHKGVSVNSGRGGRKERCYCYTQLQAGFSNALCLDANSIDRPMSKRYCKFFARGACVKGEQCEYSHDRKDSLICKFYQKGFCAYGSRCRYKHVKASQAQSSENGHQFLASDSMVARITSPRGTSNWVPKAAELSVTDKHAKILKRKHRDMQKNGDAGESSTALPPEHFFCTFSASNCPFGEKCSYIHGDKCVYCKKFCLHPTDPKERKKHQRSCEKKGKYLQTLNDSQEIECNICLEHVLSKPKASDRKFGVLPECDHAFCISCIRNWRNSAPSSAMGSNNAVRTCPVCRKLSYYVIPSNIWYSTKEEKEEIIDNYKTNCKLIDCKHFDFGNGNCPFGNNCFYKHTVKPGSYTWIHHRPPPPPRNPRNMNVLNQFGFESEEFDSIIPDFEFFNDMDPFETMPDGSGLFDFEDSDGEMDSFNLAARPEFLNFGSDTISSEESDPFDFMLLAEGLDGSGWSVPEDSEDDDGGGMGIMPPSEMLCGCSGSSYPDDSDDEEMAMFNTAAIDEPDDEEMAIFNTAAIDEPDAGSDTYYSGESEEQEWNPIEPSWLSMILHSSMEEDSSSSEGDL